MKTEKEEKKITSEKPISLVPLDVGEALRALMKVKPKDKPKKKTRRKKNTHEK